MKNRFLFFVLFILVFAACEKTVHIDIPQKPPRLVVNGLLEKNQWFELKVGKSRGVLQVNNQVTLQEQYTVKTAEVVVFENNVSIDTLIYQPSTYSYKSVHNKIVKDGFTYNIKVNASGFTTAEASSIVPSQMVIAGLTRVRNVRTNSNGNQVDEITIKLNDPFAEKNFYLVQIWRTPYGGVPSNTVYCVSTTDKDIETVDDDTDPLEPENCYDGGNLLMRDLNFNGSLKQLKLTAEAMELEEYVDVTTRRVYRPYVKVFRITEDQFKYLKSNSAYMSGEENPFSEPANVFSNVKNGYGIFSLSTVATDTLR
jgi:hypothetical protein